MERSRLCDTVWTPEMWEMSGGFRHEPVESTRVVDKQGTQLRLHPGAETAITEIKTQRRWQEAWNIFFIFFYFFGIWSAHYSSPHHS